MIITYILYLLSSGDIMMQFPSKEDCEIQLQNWDGQAACKAITHGRER